MQTPVELFLVALPGLEDLVKNELLEKFPQLEAKVEFGGVTTHAPLAIGLSLNQILKTPTRILVRIAKFRCRDFPKLFNKIDLFPWHFWIDTDGALSVVASSRKSRLKIKKRIEDTALAAWRSMQLRAKKTADPSKAVTLYVRMQDDECLLSLDTSGERLHKRGLRDKIGVAPLRETIAASLLYLGLTHRPQRDIEIVDPMMGSGAFLSEAQHFAEVISTRDFPFGVFREQPAALPEVKSNQFISFAGFERDPETFRSAQANLASADLKPIDFFKAEPMAPRTEDRWIMANPPYGERLKVNEPLPQFYAALFEQCERVARPDLACFLLPKVGRLAVPPQWKLLEKRGISNGGIPIDVFVFGRQAARAVK